MSIVAFLLPAAGMVCGLFVFEEEKRRVHTEGTEEEHRGR
jgi:hypothetical protein